MPAKRALTDEEEKIVAELYRTGSSTDDLAGQYEVNADTIRNIVKRHGVPLRARGVRPGHVFSGRR